MTVALVGPAAAAEWRTRQPKPWEVWEDFPRGPMCISKGDVYFESAGEQCKPREGCEYISVKTRFNKDIIRDTKTMGVYVYRVTARCEDQIGTWDVYEGKGTGIKVDKVSQ